MYGRKRRRFGIGSGHFRCWRRASPFFKLFIESEKIVGRRFLLKGASSNEWRAVIREFPPPQNRLFAISTSRQVLPGFPQSGLDSKKKDGDWSGKSASGGSLIAEQQIRCPRLSHGDHLRRHKRDDVVVSMAFAVPTSDSIRRLFCPSMLREVGTKSQNDAPQGPDKREN